MKTSLMRSEFAFFQSSLQLFQTKYLVKCRRIPLELNRKFRRRSFTHASSRKNEICHSRPNHAVAAKKWRRRKKTSEAQAQWPWEHSPPSSVAWVRVPVSTLYVSWVCCWISPLLWEVLFPGIPVYTSTKNQKPASIAQTFLKSMDAPRCFAGIKSIFRAGLLFHCLM